MHIGPLSYQQRGYSIRSFEHQSLKHFNPQLKDAIMKCINLKRFKEAWMLCQLANNRESWMDLAKAAATHMELEFGT